MFSEKQDEGIWVGFFWGVWDGLLILLIEVNLFESIEVEILFLGVICEGIDFIWVGKRGLKKELKGGCLRKKGGFDLF